MTKKMRNIIMLVIMVVGVSIAIWAVKEYQYREVAHQSYSTMMELRQELIERIDGNIFGYEMTIDRVENYYIIRYHVMETFQKDKDQKNPVEVYMIKGDEVTKLEG